MKTTIKILFFVLCVTCFCRCYDRTYYMAGSDCCLDKEFRKLYYKGTDLIIEDEYITELYWNRSYICSKGHRYLDNRDSTHYYFIRVNPSIPYNVYGPLNITQLHDSLESNHIVLKKLNHVDLDSSSRRFMDYCSIFVPMFLALAAIVFFFYIFIRNIVRKDE